MVGGGIAAMHYTGMAAFEIAGTIIWDTTLVAASIVLGAVIGSAALPVGLKGGNGLKLRAAGAALLTLAIGEEDAAAAQAGLPFRLAVGA